MSKKKKSNKEEKKEKKSKQVKADKKKDKKKESKKETKKKIKQEKKAKKEKSKLAKVQPTKIVQLNKTIVTKPEEASKSNSSKNYNAKTAISLIRKMTNASSVTSFAKGDVRVTVKTVAAAKIASLSKK